MVRQAGTFMLAYMMKQLLNTCVCVHIMYVCAGIFTHLHYCTMFVLHPIHNNQHYRQHIVYRRMYCMLYSTSSVRCHKMLSHAKMCYARLCDYTLSWLLLSYYHNKLCFDILLSQWNEALLEGVIC